MQVVWAVVCHTLMRGNDLRVELLQNTQPQIVLACNTSCLKSTSRSHSSGQCISAGTWMLGCMLNYGKRQPQT